jgi:hypothetical protein
MTLGLAAWAGRILGLSLFDPRLRNPGTRNVHEVRHGATKLLRQHEQHVEGRVADPSLNLGVVAKGDALHLLLSSARQVPGVTNVASHQSTKTLGLHAPSVSVDATCNPSTIVTAIMVLRGSDLLRGGRWFERASAWGCTAVLLVGCSAVQEMAMTPEERAVSRAKSCTAADERTWDLGTGTAAELTSNARGFYALGSEEWEIPGEPTTTGSAGDSRAAMDAYNSRRLTALRNLDAWTRSEPESAGPVRLRLARIGNIQAYEFTVPPEYATPTTVHVVSTDPDKVAFVATLGRCPTLTAEDTCVDRKLRTSVKISGETACASGVSLPSGSVGLQVRFDDQQYVYPVVDGEPIVVATNEIGLDIREEAYRVKQVPNFLLTLRVDGNPAWEGQLPLNSLQGASAKSALIMEKAGGLEQAVVHVLGWHPSARANAKFMQSLAEARMATAAADARTIVTPDDALRVVSRYAFGKGLPKDDEVLGLVSPVRRAEVDPPGDA